MRLNNVMNAAAYGISTAALAFGLSTGALAQTTPQTGCQPKAQVEAVISGGGYKAIAVGNRVDGVGNANIFFANKDGYGFSAEGDRPLGTPTVEKICVLDRYKEVRVNDPRNPNPPFWLTVKDGDGKQFTDFTKAYNQGHRIVFTAKSYDFKNGLEVAGKTLAIIAGEDKAAAVMAIDFKGYGQANTTLKQFALTTNANAFVVPDKASVAVAQVAQTVAPR